METIACLTDGSAECDNDERHEKVYVYIARTINADGRDTVGLCPELRDQFSSLFLC